MIIIKKIIFVIIIKGIELPFKKKKKTTTTKRKWFKKEKKKNDFFLKIAKAYGGIPLGEMRGKATFVLRANWPLSSSSFDTWHDIIPNCCIKIVLMLLLYKTKNKKK